MTEPVTVTVGGKQLIYSGLVHMDNLNEVAFKIRSLTYVFRFVTDKGNTRFISEIDTENNKMILNLYNFSSSLGEGKLEQVQIGTVDDKALSVTWFVQTVSVETNTRAFQFALYLEA